MHQKLVAIGDDFVVEDAEGRTAFRIDGKALRVRNTLKMRDLATGDEYKLQERMARVRNTMKIEKNGRPAATVKKAVVSPIRDRFTVSVADGPDLEVRGNILDHEYRLEANGERVAEVSKKWFCVRDSYGIEVSPDVDAGLLVACAVTLDMMSNPMR